MSARAPMPFMTEMMNTRSGTSDRIVVYARLIARTPISPPSQSRISAAG